jgi:hypothetical protein
LTTEIGDIFEIPDALQQRAKGNKAITGTAQSSTSPASSSLDLISEFLSAKTAIDAGEIIDRAHGAGLEFLAHDMEKELNSRCAHMDPNMTPMFERTKWALELAVAFCAGYTGGKESNSNGPAPPSRGQSITMAKLLNMFTSLGEIEFESEFARLLANASTPREIEIAEEFISAMADSGVNFLMGRTDHSYPQPTTVPDIHRAALDLYSCQRFGGCGPTDWHTLELCFVTGHCDPGWSTIDFYQNTLSPVELRLAMDVFYFLSGLQKEGDG